MLQEPGVSPDEIEQPCGEKGQKQRAHLGLPSSAQEAAALIHADMLLPLYQCVICGQKDALVKMQGRKQKPLRVKSQRH